jgi:hypothetical protein
MGDARYRLGQQETHGRAALIRPRARTEECSRLLVCRFLRGLRHLGPPPEMLSSGSTPVTPIALLL